MQLQPTNDLRQLSPFCSIEKRQGCALAEMPRVLQFIKTAAKRNDLWCDSLLCGNAKKAADVASSVSTDYRRLPGGLCVSLSNVACERQCAHGNLCAFHCIDSHTCLKSRAFVHVSPACENSSHCPGSLFCM